MKAAIIAAGLGERLQQAGIAEPKPLVRVAGRPLIDYALAAISASGISSVACIVNEIFVGIEDHCRTTWPRLDFDFVRRTTPSSMESLFALQPFLHERFVLMTVDSIFAPEVLRQFLDASAARAAADGVLAITDYVDDEKPLWTKLDDTGRIVALGPEAVNSGWITAGIYVFEPRIFDEIATARSRQFTALRQFLGHLVASGYRIDAEPMGKSLDVDRAEDIAAAEAFVRRGCGD